MMKAQQVAEIAVEHLKRSEDGDGHDPGTGRGRTSAIESQKAANAAQVAQALVLLERA